MNFSVLMSIYYKENPSHFDECMKSVWDNQTLKPTEIILVQDGELTLKLYQKIDEWKAKLGDVLNVMQLSQNIGTGNAKNIGLNHCKYEIICIVDTDDICMPERFEKQINFFKNNPNVDIVGGQIYEFVDGIDSLTTKRIVPCKHKDLVDFAKTRSPFNNMTIAYKKEVVLRVGGYHHHLWMEDYNLFLRLIASGCQLHNLEDFLVYVRIDNGMHGRRRGIRYIQSEKQLFDLKLYLKLQSFIPALLIFLVRVSIRLLPTEWLKKFYGIFLRNDAIK